MFLWHVAPTCSPDVCRTRGHDHALADAFQAFIPHLAEEYGFEYELVTYKWPHWLRAQTEKQRIIWAYKILFLDVLFPMDLDKVIFVDAGERGTSSYVVTG